MNTPLQNIVEMFGLHFAIIKEFIFNIYIYVHVFFLSEDNTNSEWGYQC